MEDGFGEDRNPFTECNEELRRRALESGLESGLDSGLEDTGEVARLIDDIRRIYSQQCGAVQWDLFPVRGGYEFCGVFSDTGRRDDGVLVINWHRDHPAMDGALCWVFDPALGTWSDYHDPAG